MKVIYAPEQKKKAVKTYKKLQSYTKTVRILGYPSLHVLHDWVNGLNHKNPSTRIDTTSSITPGRSNPKPRCVLMRVKISVWLPMNSVSLTMRWYCQ